MQNSNYSNLRTSYSLLHRAWKREKENEELQPLDGALYSDLSHYIQNQKSELLMLDEKTLKAQLISEECRNMKQFLTALIQSRYRKISERVVQGKKIPKNHLTPEEEVIYSGLLSTCNYMKTFLKEILKGRRPKAKELQFVNKPKRILIRFLKGIPAIIGPDMKTYGPFKEEDIASLPIENVESLIKRGVAVKVDVP